MGIGEFLIGVLVAGYAAFIIMGFATYLAVRERVYQVFKKSPGFENRKLWWNGYEDPEKYGRIARWTVWPLVMIILNLIIGLPLIGIMNAVIDVYRTIYFDACLKSICKLNDINIKDLDQSVVNSEKAMLLSSASGEPYNDR